MNSIDATAQITEQKEDVAIAALDEHFKAGDNFDRDRFEWEKQKTKYAIVAGFVAVLVAIIAIVYRPPPVTITEPYLVRFNSATGIVDVQARVINGLTTYEEELNIFFIQRYVLCREGYAIFTYEKQWNECSLFTPEDKRNEEIWPLFNVNDPRSFFKRYGKTGSVTIEFAYTKPTSEANKYETHFTLVETINGEIVRSNWVSSIKFVYNSGLMKKADRQTNPLGFQVLAYRRDIEAVKKEPSK